MKRIPYFFTMLTLFLVASCSDDDDAPAPAPLPEVTMNIVETAQDASNLNSLVAALLKADESPNNDLVATLGNAEGTFTVLAPTDAAFDDLFDRLDGFESLDDFNTQETQDLLAAILTYHVVAGSAVASSGLSNEQTLTTVLEEEVTVSTTGGVSFIDAAGESAGVVTADVEATNGIVHIIDKVLIPQAALDALEGTLLFSITATAIGNENLTSLVAALQAADGDLPTVLEGSGPFTVLAPTNDAFTTFLDGRELGDIPTDELAQVLLNHVISGEVTSTDLTMAGSGYASTSASGPVEDSNLSIFYNTADGVRFNGVSSVVPNGADILATNGIIHVVDAVIDLPDIVDHALANPNLSALVGLLTQDGDEFTNLLSGTEMNFTVLAPVNSAIESFTTENEIPNVLSNHVIVGAAARSTDLATGYDNVTAATNVDGDNISLYVNVDDGVRFNGVSGVVEDNFDIIATNGVIHAVDAVIDIPTVTTFAIADPNFSTLVTALTTLTPDTAFEQILARTAAEGDNIDPPFTVFAPINAAFDALEAIPDEPVLTSVLLHHVIGGANVRSMDLTPDGQTMAPSLEGDMITITLPGTGENIADITDGSGATDIGIIAVDVQAGNGVIHAINKVMIPDTSN